MGIAHTESTEPYLRESAQKRLVARLEKSLESVQGSFAFVAQQCELSETTILCRDEIFGFRTKGEARRSTQLVHSQVVSVDQQLQRSVVVSASR